MRYNIIILVRLLITDKHMYGLVILPFRVYWVDFVFHGTFAVRVVTDRQKDGIKRIISSASRSIKIEYSEPLILL